MSKIRLYATHTPAKYESFRTITVSMSIPGVFCIDTDLTPEQARAHAAEVIAACEIVERDRADHERV